MSNCNEPQTLCLPHPWLVSMLHCIEKRVKAGNISMGNREVCPDLTSGPLKPQEGGRRARGNHCEEPLVLSVLLSKQGGRDHRQGVR